jgi:hypothetical protein
MAWTRAAEVAEQVRQVPKIARCTLSLSMGNIRRGAIRETRAHPHEVAEIGEDRGISFAKWLNWGLSWTRIVIV